MNKLIPASEVARDLVAAIDKATADFSKRDKRKFVRDFAECIYRFNGFPPVRRRK